MVGRSVGQYKFVEKLGAGGMGEIYKAQDTKLNRFVAIKVLPAAKSGDPERRKRFLQEAQAASSLNHPSIITIHDVLSEGDTEFMVMEFVIGKTLNDTIPKGGLRVPQALKYALQMADALSAAHGAGIIHRDLKPANVMLNQSGLIKVLDFGLAKLTDRSPMGLIGEDEETMVASAPLTVEGAIMGTVSYMSPEQAQGMKVDARSDIFSFGALLYEMVTGLRAFEGETALTTLSAILRDDVRPMIDVAPDVPPQLETVIQRCLKKKEDDRYQSMREVQAALSLLKRDSDSGSLYTMRVGVVNPLSGEMPAPSGAPISLGSTTASGSQSPLAQGLASQGPASQGPASDVRKPSPVTSLGERATNTKIAVAAGVVAVLLAGAGTFFYLRERSARQAATESARVASQAAAEAAAQAQAQLEEQQARETAAKLAAEQTVTNDSIVNLVTEKVPLQLILDHIRTAETTQFDLSTTELIRLTKAGVSAVLVEQMRNPKRVFVLPSSQGKQAKSSSTAVPIPVPVTATSTPAPAPTPTSVPIATSGDSHVLAVAPAVTPVAAPVTSAVQTMSVQLSDAVPFRITLAAAISADAEQGRALRFVASEDFKAQGVVIIRKGASIFGEVSEGAKKGKFFGMGASKLSFVLTRAEGAGGQDVKVRAVAARRADGPVQRQVMASTQGAEYIAYIDGPQTVTVPK